MIEKQDMTGRPFPKGLALVMTDVDGTLVTRDKRLTPAAIEAAASLRAAKIGLSLASSRPPFGLASLVSELQIAAPFAAFNGGVIAARDGRIFCADYVPPEIAADAIQFFEQAGVDVWAFTPEEWFCRDPAGDYVAHETRTVSQPPKVIADFSSCRERLGKIVAVSPDAERLARVEQEAQRRFAGRAVAARSQAYYLDVTNLAANKADALKKIARLCEVSLEQCAAIGDGANDVGMLAIAGFGIAMGNAVAEVKAAADFETAGNDADGFALAVRRLTGAVR